MKRAIEDLMYQILIDLFLRGIGRVSEWVGLWLCQ